MSDSGSQTTDLTSSSLYGIGGAAAVLCALTYLVTLAVFVPANLAGPPPATVREWFSVFQTDPLAGLFFLGLGDVVIMILWGPLSLALYTALKRTSETWSLVATAFVFVGMAVYLATNTASSMLYLSQKHAAATTEAERSIVLAAGQAILALCEGTGGRYTGMPLAWLAGVIFSVVMLRSALFGKAAAWVGIAGFGLLLASVPFAGYTTAGSPTAIQSVVIAVTYAGGGLLSLAWYILSGVRLWGLRGLQTSALRRGS